jgi:hypothetical protein
MDCFASLAMTTNSTDFRQPHFEPNSQEPHRRTLAKAGSKRLEGRTLREGQLHPPQELQEYPLSI